MVIGSISAHTDIYNTDGTTPSVIRDIKSKSAF